MPVFAGQLRQRLELQAPSGALDADHSPVEGYSTVATLWAKVTPLSARELVDARQISPRISHQIEVRYRTDITTRHCFKMGGRVFNVSAPPMDVDERHEMLRILAEEVVSS